MRLRLPGGCVAVFARRLEVVGRRLEVVGLCVQRRLGQRRLQFVGMCGPRRLQVVGGALRSPPNCL